MAGAVVPSGRMAGSHGASPAWVGMEADGTAMVRCAAPDPGGGQGSSLVAIAAEVLGLPMSRVSIGPADSHMAPRAGTTTATRQLFMSATQRMPSST